MLNRTLQMSTVLSMDPRSEWTLSVVLWACEDVTADDLQYDN
jgi:hypothetical protein